MLTGLSHDDAWALALSTLAGLSTSLGGILAVLQRPDNYRLAFLLGIAIGVMASLSILEMFLHNALENGFGVTPSFIAGAAAFYFANPYFPEFDVSGLSKFPSHSQQSHSSQEMDEESRTGSPRAVGDCNGSHLSSSTHTMKRAQRLNRAQSESAVAANHPDGPDDVPGVPGSTVPPQELLRLGLLMAVTMTIHNCPEGFAVAFAANTDIGPMMALAIAIHNIPEGIIVAAPVYAATGNRWIALGIATVSGLSEPLGALAALLFIRPFLSQHFLNYIIGFVGGVMFAVCVCELWPEARKCQANKELAEGCIFGTLIMMWTLHMGC